ncbi:hypothetical protein N7535_001985 [Penicillium sp. DV-2018c]|nr:hypothetical protein N7461_004770 [Penicillium sp. DV-2018c]KAJ5583365.1 hypothetical protein N7535_001985 [Penicillium sp. DV-2018c]
MFGSLIDQLNAPAPEEDMSDEASGDIPFKNPSANGTDEQNEGSDNEEEEDEDDEEEGVYVVEDIMLHDWLDDGTLKLLVKWKGYDDEKDRTWEDEEGLLDGASEIVNAYYERIGGRPKKPEKKAPAGKASRKRKSTADRKSTTPAKKDTATEAKRQRRKSTTPQRKATPQKRAAKQDTPTSDEDEAEVSWVPKGKNWDKEVRSVDTIVREGDRGLMAWLEFNNGRKSRIPVEICYEKCPLKMLKFYESHLVFKDG